MSLTHAFLHAFLMSLTRTSLMPLTLDLFAFLMSLDLYV